MATYSDIPYLTRVARGLVPGAIDWSFTGVDPATSSSTPHTLWDYTGAARVTLLTADTQLYVSSSSASDTTQTVSVSGVNNAGAIVTRTATLNGQNQVALSGLIQHVHTGLIITPTSVIGDVYIAESDTLTGGVPNTASKVKAKIIAGQIIEYISQSTTGTPLATVVVDCALIPV